MINNDVIVQLKGFFGLESPWYWSMVTLSSQPTSSKLSEILSPRMCWSTGPSWHKYRGKKRLFHLSFPRFPDYWQIDNSKPLLRWRWGMIAIRTPKKVITKHRSIFLFRCSYTGFRTASFHFPADMIWLVFLLSFGYPLYMIDLLFRRFLSNSAYTRGLSFSSVFSPIRIKLGGVMFVSTSGAAQTHDLRCTRSLRLNLLPIFGVLNPHCPHRMGNWSKHLNNVHCEMLSREKNGRVGYNHQTNGEWCIGGNAYVPISYACIDNKSV
jgi:hypothetical protein